MNAHLKSRGFNPQSWTSLEGCFKVIYQKLHNACLICAGTTGTSSLTLSKKLLAMATWTLESFPMVLVTLGQRKGYLPSLSTSGSSAQTGSSAPFDNATERQNDLRKDHPRAYSRGHANTLAHSRCVSNRIRSSCRQVCRETTCWPYVRNRTHSTE